MRMLHSAAAVTPASGARVPEYHMPENNYLSGDWKSHTWKGPAYYVPSERRWIAYHNYRTLPYLAKGDALDMQSEQEYVDFVRSRDTPSGFRYRNIGLLPCKYPALKLSGYKRELPSMPSHEVLRKSWPAERGQFHVTHLPRGEYYGYYHEVLNANLHRSHKDVPSSLKIGPCDVPHYGYIPNLIFGKTTFSGSIDRNNPMYINTFCTGIQRTHHIDQPEN